MPRGCFTALVYNAEGIDAAKFLNNLGITAFVMKYRLFREKNSPYIEENTKQDVFRAIRLIENNTRMLDIDTAKIDIMEFSARGELTSWLLYHCNEVHNVQNAYIDSVYARPAFQILIYLRPLAAPKIISNNAPPTFLLASNNDT